MDSWIKVILGIWILLAYVLIVCAFGRGIHEVLDVVLLIAFTLATGLVLTLLVT